MKLIRLFSNMRGRCQRLWYTLKSFKSYGRVLNDKAAVESVLWSVASGKRDLLSREECRALAIQLGVPPQYRLPRPADS